MSDKHKMLETIQRMESRIEDLKQKRTDEQAQADARRIVKGIEENIFGIPDVYERGKLMGAYLVCAAVEEYEFEDIGEIAEKWLKKFIVKRLEGKR